MKSLHMQPLHLGKEAELDLETRNTRSVSYWRAKRSDYREAV
jgi:hypothetical protein